MNLEEAEVKKIEYIGSSFLLLTLIRPEFFKFFAGQHTVFHLRDKQGEFQRTYSISSPPHFYNSLEFCIQLQTDGRSSAFLSQLGKGDKISIVSAQGKFKIENKKNPLVFIAGGSGIAPVRSFILDLLNDSTFKGSIKLVYGCREASSVPYLPDFLSLASQFNEKFKTSIYAESGLIPGVMEGIVSQGLIDNSNWIKPDCHFYLCGSKNMTEEITKILLKKGISLDHIFKEY